MTQKEIQKDIPEEEDRNHIIYLRRYRALEIVFCALVATLGRVDDRNELADYCFGHKNLLRPYIPLAQDVPYQDLMDFALWSLKPQAWHRLLLACAERVLHCSLPCTRAFNGDRLEDNAWLQELWLGYPWNEDDAICYASRTEQGDPAFTGSDVLGQLVLPPKGVVFAEASQLTDDQLRLLAKAKASSVLLFSDPAQDVYREARAILERAAGEAIEDGFDLTRARDSDPATNPLDVACFAHHASFSLTSRPKWGRFSRILKLTMRNKSTIAGIKNNVPRELYGVTRLKWDIESLYAMLNAQLTTIDGSTNLLTLSYEEGNKIFEENADRNHALLKDLVRRLRAEYDPQGALAPDMIKRFFSFMPSLYGMGYGFSYPQGEDIHCF